MRHLYLDDCRDTPEGCERAYSAPEAIEMLNSQSFGSISLDHDLGDYEGNGNDVLLWIEEKVHTDLNWIPPVIYIHTSNPAAFRKMQLGADKLNSLREKRLK